jgi:hypothetical protein
MPPQYKFKIIVFWQLELLIHSVLCSYDIRLLLQGVINDWLWVWSPKYSSRRWILLKSEGQVIRSFYVPSACQEARSRGFRDLKFHGSIEYSYIPILFIPSSLMSDLGTT